MQTGLIDAPATPWNPKTALALYRATMRRMGDHYNALDVFEKPSLQRADIVAADKACLAAWDAQDDVALRQALATWERAVTGGQHA